MGCKKEKFLIKTFHAQAATLQILCLLEVFKSIESRIFC